VTAGEVNTCNAVQQLVAWLRKQGVDTSSVNKETVIDLLGEDLPPQAERALQLRQEAAKASTAKIDAFIQRTSPDGRMRGNLCYHGAGTGRWAGRGAQLQNLPRPTPGVKITEQDIANLRTGDPLLVGMLYDRPLTFVADCIRSMLIAAARKDLIASDFANIEGRVNAWLAGQSDKLELFAADGPIYERMGGVIFGLSTEEVVAKGKDAVERDIGKRAELGCGYQMGAPKFKATAKREANKIIPIELAVKAVKAFREVNHKIVAFWSNLEAAAIDAVRRPGEVTICGRIKFRKHGSFLVCQLPSGRCIYYPYPRLVQNVWVLDLKTKAKRTMRLDAAREAQGAEKVKIDGQPYQSLVYKGVDTYTKKWQEIDTYGGKLVENVTQAVARDLMADAMLRIDAAGYPVILTVHDEVLSEPAEGFGSVEEFDRMMAEIPGWAAGCPVSAKGWRGKRYRK
jgi:DNA polymerase